MRKMTVEQEHYRTLFMNLTRLFSYLGPLIGTISCIITKINILYRKKYIPYDFLCQR